MEGSALAAGAARRGGTAAWYVLAILLVIYTFNYIDRYLVAGLAEPIKRDFGLSDSFLGFLLGPAFAVLYTTAGIPLARLADRMSRVVIIAIGCAFWSLFTVLSGLAGSGFVFALTRIGVGLGEAAFLAPAYSLLADYFPAQRRAFAYAILGLGLYLGQVLGLVLGPLLATYGGWHVAFVVLGFPGIGVALLLLLTVREAPRPHLAIAPSGAAHEKFWPTLRALWARRSFRWLTLGAAAGGFSGFSFGLWGPTFFTRVLGMPLAEANTAFGLAFGICGLLGMLAFGWACDRLARRDRAWPMRLSGAAMAAATIFVMLVCVMPDATSGLLLAIPAGLLGGGWAVGLLTTIQELVPTTVRATATAVYSFLLTFIGLVGGPMMVGVLSDQFQAFGTDALRYALLPTTSVGLLGALLLFLGSARVAEDTDLLARELAVKA